MQESDDHPTSDARYFGFDQQENDGDPQCPEDSPDIDDEPQTNGQDGRSSIPSTIVELSSQSSENDLIPPSERLEDDHKSFKVRRTLEKKLQKSTFLGIISFYGKSRFTLDNYAHLEMIVSEYEIIPCSMKMRQHVFPFLVKDLFVKSSIV